MENEPYITDTSAVNTDEQQQIAPHETVFAWLALLFGFIFTHFALNYAGGLWGGLLGLSFGAAGAAFAVKKRLNIEKGQLFVFAISEVFCFVPLLCANRFINILAALFTFALHFYLLASLSGGVLFGRHFVSDMLKSVFIRPFRHFARQPVCALSAFNNGTALKNAVFGLVGILVAVPLTVTVCTLLMSSDDIFESTIRGFQSEMGSFSPAILVDILFAIPVSMYIFGALISAKHPLPAKADDTPVYRIIPPITCYFGITPVCLFYIYYIGIQLYRIFGGEKPQQAAGYSEFARRGFFELCAIAVINLAVIIAIQTFSKRRENDRKPLLLKVFTVTLCLLTLGIIATALTKMAMYIGELGMTQLRIYTSWFMILLIFVFLIIIVLQFADIAFWKVIFAVFTVMFGMLCFGNIDEYIAIYNINAYQSGDIESLDTAAFIELGFSAAAPAAALYKSGCDDMELRYYLDNVAREDDYLDKFAYFSVQRAKAHAALADIEVEKPIG